MSLKRIQYNTVFNLTTNIRKFTYDIEQYLKNDVTKFQIIPAAIVPDEIEPDIPRYIAQANVNDKIIKFEISQLRITFFLEAVNTKSLTDDDFNNFISRINFIKDKLSKIIPNFHILYEGIIVFDENILKDIKDIKLIHDFSDKNDESRIKESILLDEKHFMITEKVVLRIFNPENSIPSLSKNDDSTLVGFMEAYVREINNRYLYNTIDNGTNNPLNLEEISSKLKEDISYE